MSKEITKDEEKTQERKCRAADLLSRITDDADPINGIPDRIKDLVAVQSKRFRDAKTVTYYDIYRLEHLLYIIGDFAVNIETWVDHIKKDADGIIEDQTLAETPAETHQRWNYEN